MLIIIDYNGEEPHLVTSADGKVMKFTDKHKVNQYAINNCPGAVVVDLSDESCDAWIPE